MSQLTLRHYHSTFGYLHRDPEQTSLFKKRRPVSGSRKEEGSLEPESVGHARRKIKAALREFVKGGLD